MVSPSWGVFELEGLAISIYIGSLGTTANLTNPGYVFAAQVDPSVGAVGFGGNGTTSPFWVNFTLTAADILNSAAPAFSTYNLTTSIGPITDSSGDDGAPNPYIFFSTNEGWLQISSVTTSTFSATLEPITIPTPEPTTMALFGLGLACLAVFKRRT